MKTTNAIILTLLLSTSVLFGQSTWKADKVHSRVNFTVNHMVISEVTGRFNDFDATLVASKDDFSDAKIEATIKTGTIDTDNEGRDKHLRSDDFFNSEKFPNMTFKSTRIERTGNGTYKITGDLTIRDVTKPVVLETKFNGIVNDPWGNVRAGFKATTTIDRFEFGVKWNKTIESGGLIVGRNVDVTLLFEFNKQNPEGKSN